MKTFPARTLFGRHALGVWLPKLTRPIVQWRCYLVHLQGCEMYAAITSQAMSQSFNSLWNWILAWAPSCHVPDSQTSEINAFDAMFGSCLSFSDYKNFSLNLTGSQSSDFYNYSWSLYLYSSEIFKERVHNQNIRLWIAMYKWCVTIASQHM